MASRDGTSFDNRRGEAGGGTSYLPEPDKDIPPPSGAADVYKSKVRLFKTLANIAKVLATIIGLVLALGAILGAIFIYTTGRRDDKLVLPIAQIKTEVSRIGQDVGTIKTDVGTIKTDISKMKKDIDATQNQEESLERNKGGK